MVYKLYQRGWTLAGLCRFFVIIFLIYNFELATGLANKAITTDSKVTGSSPQAFGRDLGLPKILNEKDISLYREIFGLQEKGSWKAANRLINQLQDNLLMGHVQFQRYMHPRKYRSRYRELKSWLTEYADHPGAKRIYKLALRRRPKNHLMPNAPVRLSRVQGFGNFVSKAGYRSSRKRTKVQWRRVRQIKHQIRQNVSREILTVSKKILDRKEVKHLLDQSERDSLLSRIAAAWFYRGDAEKALAIAGPAADRSRKFLSNADWVAGLSAWRLKNFKAAAQHFNALANSKVADDWNRAAGAFWAARVYLIKRQPDRVNPLLRTAAENLRTFYGLIAARQLGMELDFQWKAPPLTSKGVVQVSNIPGARRAIALAQIGQRNLAEQELRRGYLSVDPLRGLALLALAHKLDFPAIQMRLALEVRGKDDRPYDRALFPVPPWQPANGFAVDRALIFAFMRQESGFNERAQSPVGARGLMQLMPRTASFVAGDRSLHLGNKSKLFDPEFNLGLGQKYMTHLLSDQLIKGDLFRLAVAYNAGPGNLRNWLRKAKFNDDPLLFVESIPWRESRLFVERVLTNFWVYRERLSQDTPSLDAVATGHWPIFFNLDRATSVVRNVEH